MSATVIPFPTRGLTDLEVAEYLTGHCEQMMKAMERSIEAIDSIERQGRRKPVNYALNKMREDCAKFSEILRVTRNLARFQAAVIERNGGDDAA